MSLRGSKVPTVAAPALINLLDMVERVKTLAVISLTAVTFFFGNPAYAAKASPAPSIVPKATATPGKTTLNGRDRGFLKRVAKGRAKDLQIAKITAHHGRSDEVKTLATKIASDDKTTNAELKELAAKKVFELPKEKLKKERISSDDFDKKSLLALKKEHERDLAAFEKEANDHGQEDPDVRAWAQQVVPILKQHLLLINDQLAKIR